MAVVNISYEAGTAPAAVTTAEPNVSLVAGSINYVADTRIGGSQAMRCQLNAYNLAQMNTADMTQVYTRAYVLCETIPNVTSHLVAVMYSLSGSAEVVAEVQINTSGQLRIRDKNTLTATSTVTLTAGTWYRLEWRVNRQANSQELRIYQGHDTTLLGSITGTCSNATATQINRVQFGASAAGATSYARYDNTGYDTVGWLGPTGNASSVGDDGVLSYYGGGVGNIANWG